MCNVANGLPSESDYNDYNAYDARKGNEEFRETR